MTDRIDWRELPPLPVAERPEQPEKLSQTFLGRAAVCRRSALLYHEHRGGPTSLEMDRGSVFHEFAARATRVLIEQDESQMPPDVAKDLMQTVMDEPGWTISPKEADRLRIMSHHWAEGMVLDPSSIVGVEQMVELDIPPFVVRGKIDLAYTVGDDSIAVRDFKTSFHFPSQEEFEGSLQLPLYATMLAFGVPATEVPCDRCDGGGRTWDTDPDGDRCPDCGGKGFTWERGLPLGDRAQLFDLAELYPMLDVREEGGLAARQTFVTRGELADHRAYIEGLVGKVAESFRTGDWPAVPGSHCSTCPAAHECPLPPVLRDHRGAIDTPEKAAEALAWVEMHGAKVAAVKKEARNFASANGPVRVGDLVWEFQDEESEEWITGKRIGRPDSAAARDAMLEAVDRAVRFGEEFDYWEFRRKRRSTPFRKRKLTPDEKEVVPVVAGEGFGDDPPF